MKLLFYFLFFTFFISCKQQSHQTIVVKGNIKNATQNKISLISFGVNNDAIVLDTCTIDKQGNYILKTLTTDEELYALKVGTQQEIWFVNDVGEITIDANFKNYKNYKTIGSAASQSIHSFLNKFDSLIIVQKNIAKNIDTLQLKKGSDSLKNIAKAERKLLKKYLEDYCTNLVNNTNNPALKLFYLFYIHNANAIDGSDVYRLVQSASLQFPKHNQLQYLKNTFSDFVKTNPKLFLINEPATDFNYVDIDSNKINLKTFAGKYLLINFWESTNKDCNKQNSSFVNIYKQYENNNFAMLSIALDSNKQAWQKAVRKDSLIWHQVLDTLHYKSILATKYQLSKVPYNVLINPTGKVIAVDISIEELKDKLKDLIKL